MASNLYKVGVIGGMGPLATSVFYKKIIENTKAESDKDHIDMVVLSHASLPDRTEAIISGNTKEFLKSIEKDFDILNGLNVEKIVIPCNTAHYFYREFQKMTDIKIVNMVEETLKEVSCRGCEKIYVFCTDGTLESRIYERYAKEYGIEILYIEKFEQKIVMDYIYRVKKQGNFENTEFIDILNKYLKDGVLGVLACTELSVIKLDENLKEKIIDAMDILVKKTIEEQM